MPDFGQVKEFVFLLAGVEGQEELSVLLRFFVIAAVLGGAFPAGAKGPEISPEEFSMYSDWKEGCEDPRLEKFDEAAKLKKIAKNLGVSSKQLQANIDKVEPLLVELKAGTEAGIKEELEQTPIGKQVVSVELNLDSGHAVAWVKWRCGDERDRDKEAAHVAWATSQGGPVVKILGLWCVNEIDTKLFSAKIGRPALDRINKATIERFATSRYIKLFEEVRRGPHR
ncbi:MAG: hypothetical protein A2289_11945 [Deltaproteobacteria bacterium RIFOXYA12_FULL_58_15]|nr:MAG: hypothetical protein A2289_11945 [Deltaproteobacteria bacterium RIFOXYA12_FULL_58_15]OGR07897.1 MAG: hypothetical protein A2341_19505 [Deltaproteobacteria bacterium RIFOXYB12_FULL_58_9]